MNLKALAVLAAAAVAIGSTTLCSAQPADTPLLTVSGRIAKTNSPDGRSYQFSYADLEKLGRTKIVSTTTWAGKAEFEGPRLRDVLKAVGADANAKEIAVVSLDGYQKNIPIDDFIKWEVVAAHTQNGKRLDVDSKGPLWLMYPTDKYPGELRNHVTNTKLVWSLTGLVVK